MEIKTEGIISLLKQQLNEYEVDLDVDEVGEVIMVGDRPEGDIYGANLLGIKTIYINRNSETIKDISYKPDIEIKSLNQLTKII